MIQVSERDGIAVLTMTHGKANTLDVAFCNAIADQFDALRDRPVRGVILTGTGKIFSAGVDLLQISDGGLSYVQKFLPALHRMFDTVFDFPKPVVAAVNGHAIAGGCVLASCADKRIAARDAYEFLGSPEGELALVQACLYLATAPKSNAAYAAQKAAWRSAKETGSLTPPKNILNAPTKLMKNIGFGKGYSYDHASEDAFSGDNYWPDEMEPQSFYEPTGRGYEKRVAERMEFWNARRKGRS